MALGSRLYKLVKIISHAPCACFYLALFSSRRGRLCFPTKHWTVSELHGLTMQTALLFNENSMT
jgi:hypothetical protein